MSISFLVYIIAAKFQEDVDILMVLEEMLKLDDMAMPHSLMNHDLRLQFLLSLTLCQSFLLDDLSSVPLSCFFRDEFKTLCKSSLHQ